MRASASRLSPMRAIVARARSMVSTTASAL